MKKTTDSVFFLYFCSITILNMHENNNIWLLLTLLSLTACLKVTTYQTDLEDAPSNAPLVTVLYDPGALGDLSYNDMIYKGVEDAPEGL